MSEAAESEAVEAPSVPATARIRELKAAIPRLSVEAERLQHEILALAPECERGNVQAKARRKKLRAELAELIDAKADKEAAILALDPAAAAEIDAAKAAGVASHVARIEADFAERDEAAAQLDKCVASLISWGRFFNTRSTEAVSRCHGLVPENRIGWVAAPRIDHSILSALVAAGIIGPEFAPSGLEIGHHRIEEIARADTAALLPAVREAAAAQSRSTAERAANDAERQQREAESLAQIDRERRQSGARYG